MKYRKTTGAKDYAPPDCDGHSCIECAPFGCAFMSEPARPVPDITQAELDRMPLFCDTCNAQPPAVWSFLYPAFEFTAGGVLHTCDAGEWSACDDCAAAIAAGDTGKLIERAIAANPGRSAAARIAITVLQAEFMKHVERGSARLANFRAELRHKTV